MDGHTKPVLLALPALPSQRAGVEQDTSKASDRRVAALALRNPSHLSPKVLEAIMNAS